jgi:hypothetical protein
MAAEHTIGLISKSGRVEQRRERLVGIAVPEHDRPEARGRMNVPPFETMSWPTKVAREPLGVKMLMVPSPKLPISTSPAIEPNPEGATAIPHGALSVHQPDAKRLTNSAAHEIEHVYVSQTGA